MKKILILFSFFHFVAITEVNGILYSLFGEIKKQFIFWFAHKYNDDDKPFKYFFLYSTLKDSSLININNLAYLFNEIFIFKFGPIMTYILSVIVITFFTLIISFFDFLSFFLE